MARPRLPELELPDRVIRRDYVPEQELWSLLEASDVVVSLRFPTMGETSAAAVRALSLGKPLVVSDVGAFREFPDEVAIKVPVGEGEIPSIVTAINRAVTSPEMSRAALALALQQIPQFTIPVLPRGGASLWVRLPGHITDDQLASRASRHGTVISPGRSFHPAEPPASFIRLSFAAAARVEDLQEGVRRLALALPAD